MALEVTVGIDIGTTSVKALAVDAEGRVVPQPRRPRADSPRGPASSPIRRAGMAAGVPGRSRRADGSRRAARPRHPGDRRRGHGAVADRGRRQRPSGHTRAALRRRPGRRWRSPPLGRRGRRLPALAGRGRPRRRRVLARPGRGQPGAVRAGGRRLDGRPTTTVPCSTARAGRPRRWRRQAPDDLERLPDVIAGTGRWAAGRCRRCRRRRRLGGPGTVDALAAQYVAGADQPGDVLVILGATLIVWAVVPDWVERRACGPCPTHARSVPGGRGRQRRGPVRRLGRPPVAPTRPAPSTSP